MRTLRRRLMTSYANLDLPVKWKDGEVAAWATKKGIVTRRQVMAYSDKYNMSFEGNTELRAFPEFKWFAGFKGSLAANVFSGCTGLTEVSLPSDTWTLPWRFFYNCKSLTDISLPDALSSIQGYVFAECSALALSSLPTGLTSLGGYAFQGCSKITVKSLPEGLTTVTAMTFQDCVSITEMTLPSSVATIGSGAFWGCTGLTEMTFPASVTSIGGGVLYQASNVVRLRFLGTTPPTFDKDVWAMPSVPIYVPDDAIDTYKEAWKDNKLAALLKPLSEWVDE